MRTQRGGVFKRNALALWLLYAKVLDIVSLYAALLTNVFCPQR